MRRSLITVVLTLVIALTGCAGARPASPGSPAPSPSAPALVTMPDVVGHNADVAIDELRKLGLSNVDLGTVDGRRIVVLPQNWTVKTQSAAAGTHVATDTKIVLGCARIGGSHWSWSHDESPHDQAR